MFISDRVKERGMTKTEHYSVYTGSKRFGCTCGKQSYDIEAMKEHWAKTKAGY